MSSGDYIFAGRGGIRKRTRAPVDHDGSRERGQAEGWRDGHLFDLPLADSLRVREVEGQDLKLRARGETPVLPDHVVDARVELGPGRFGPGGDGVPAHVGGGQSSHVAAAHESVSGVTFSIASSSSSAERWSVARVGANSATQAERAASEA